MKFFKAGDDKCIGVAAVVAILCTFTLIALFLLVPIMHFHAFRQAQTALTAKAFIDGFRIDYITPVLGMPWTIPFEFPSYQAVVFLFADFFNADIVSTGRMLSLLFFSASIYPLYGIMGYFTERSLTQNVFILLLIASPFYVFWGTAFMIESTALFFTLMSLLGGMRVLNQERSFFNIFLFGFFGVLAILTKATTYLPPVFLMCVVYFVLAARKIYLIPVLYANLALYKESLKNSGIIIILFFSLAVFLIGVSWVDYTDRLKSANLFGEYITSKRLQQFNFGTLGQRFSSDIIKVPARFILLNPGLLIFLLIPLLDIRKSIFLVKKNRNAVISAAMCIAAFSIYIVVFTNLHFLHDYYQYANGFWLIAFLSILIVDVLEFGSKKIWRLIVAVSMVNLLSACIFGYARPAFGNVSDVFKNRSQLANYINSFKCDGGLKCGLIVYGLDWTSEMHYRTSLRGIAVPTEWSGEDFSSLLPSYEKTFVIICPDLLTKEKVDDIMNFYEGEIGYNSKAIGQCKVFDKKIF